MKNFAITGAAGYIAPRHLKAIKDTGSSLIAALDPHDSVGILDRFFPDASFFSEFERFDRHLEKLRRQGGDGALHYLSVCSPNHLHDAHVRLALRLGADAICEKPLVLNPWNLDALEELENETEQRVYTVLQLRLHPVIVALKKKIESSADKKHKVVLKYITPRGPWYRYSWKGDIEKSGGIATNIGVHFFDMLHWIFGGLDKFEITIARQDKMQGRLWLENADVEWFLSIDKNDLPLDNEGAPRKTVRSIVVDGQEIDFTDGFADLHTIVYKEILNGGGFGISDARRAIETVHKLRNYV